MVSLVVGVLFGVLAQCAPDLLEDVGNRSFVDPRNSCGGRTRQAVLQFGIPTVVHNDPGLDDFESALSMELRQSAFGYAADYFSSRNACI